MAQEIELKLSLPRQLHARFAASPLLSQYAQAQPSVKTLYNDYFDTPQQALNRQAIALRIRRQGERFIQTLKTQGDSQGGLHQRHEWEWDLPEPKLNVALFPADTLPSNLALDTLAPAFTTHFQRTTWLLHYPYGDETAEIELVLDNGSASTGERSDPISEVELELKAGPAEALFAFALTLAEQFPLRISRISKGERGYRLQQPQRTAQLPERPSPNASERDRLLGLMDRALSALEAYEFQRDAALLKEAAAALNDLNATLTDAFSNVALRQSLTDLLAELTALSTLEDAEQQYPQARAWLEQRALGACLLRLSQALYLGR